MGIGEIRERERAVHVMSNSIEGIVGSKVSGVIESDKEREKDTDVSKKTKDRLRDPAL